MALTLAKILNRARKVDANMGDRVVIFRDVTFDASYATGGLALTATSLGLEQVYHVSCDGGAKNTAGTSVVPVRYDYVTGKLQAYRYDGAAVGKAFLEEVAAAVDLSTFTVRLRIEGRRLA